MAIRDTYADLASIAVAVPAKYPSHDDYVDEWEYEGATHEFEDAMRAWHGYRDELELATDASNVDPVLSEIRDARAAMLRAEKRMRLLIAYARTYVTPRPYRLEDLAEAAGMSISGVRTAYGDDEAEDLDERLADSPAKRRP